MVNLNEVEIGSKGRITFIYREEREKRRELGLIPKPGTAVWVKEKDTTRYPILVEDELVKSYRILPSDLAVIVKIKDIKVHTTREAKDMVKHWLDKTALSERAKKVLIKEANTFFSTLMHAANRNRRRPINKSSSIWENYCKSALFLACDKNLCSIPRKLPRPKMKYLSHARKILNIKYVNPEDRVASLCKLLLGKKCNEHIKKTAKELISVYNKHYTYGSTPAILATAAVYQAARVNGVPITPKTVAATTGIMIVPLKNITDRMNYFQPSRLNSE